MDNRKKDEFFMLQALALAELAQKENEVPIGAVVVLNDEIIGQGYNCPIKNCDPCAHAEIIALKDAAKNINNYRLLDVTLYTTLEPCIMCAGAIVHARIKKLVFAAKDEKAGAIISRAQILDLPYLNHKILYEYGVLQNRSSDLLKNFFQTKRK